MEKTKMSDFISGFISVVGRPNVGKSTLINLLTGEKIAIVTNKPQTTRNTITAIITDENSQIVLMDTPGIHSPKSKLGQYMVKSAESAFQEIDVILFLTEPNKKIPAVDISIIEKLSGLKSPVFLVINKIDTIPKEELLSIIDQYRQLMNFKEIVPVSALHAKNTDELLKTIKKYLKPGPKYFPEDMVTDQPERQIAAEIIREKALLRLGDEIPHGIAVEITSMSQRKDRSLIDMEATIYCEKDSHKGMVIGKQGAKLKEIGSMARADIEGLLGTSVNLQLWVKVKKDWRDSDFWLKNFGYRE